MFVADRNANVVKEVPAGSNTPVTIGAGFVSPYSVAVDGAGNVYVADYYDNAIKKITPVGGYYVNPYALPVGLSFNNSTGVISGKPTALSPAANYTVSAYNYGGGSSATVIISVTANANLASLALSSGTLAPVFAANTISYTASVANATATSITITTNNR